MVECNVFFLVRFVGVDPGIRNVFFAHAVDGSKARITQGEFRNLTKYDAYNRQLAAADRARPLTARKEAAQVALDAFKANADPTRRRADAAAVAALQALQDGLDAARKAAASAEAALKRAWTHLGHMDGFVQAGADAASALQWFFRAAAADPAMLAQGVADAADANADTRQTRTARKKAKLAAKAARRLKRQALADVDAMTDVDVAIHAFGQAQTRMLGHAIYLYLPLGGTKGHARQVPQLYLAIRHALADYITSYNKRSVRDPPHALA